MRTSSVLHKQKRRARGKLVKAEIVGHLRQGDRWWAPAGGRVVRISGVRVAMGAVVAAAIVAGSPGLAAAQPTPDPYQSQTTPSPAAKPSTPTPDPAPAPPAAQTSSPEPDSNASSTTTAQTPKSVRTTEPVAERTSPPPASPVRSGPVGPRVLLTPAMVNRRPTFAAPSTTDGRPLALAALALLALALASGSLLHLLARTDGLWRKA